MITNWEPSGEAKRKQERIAAMDHLSQRSRAPNRSHKVEHIERSNVQYGFLCAIRSLCNRTAH